MKGNPKYKINDLVEFNFDGTKLQGNIYIIDKYGTFDNPTDVSYDIMVKSCPKHPNGCLYKHITETEIIDLFKKSKTFRSEYSCSIVKIKKVEPINNSDFLGQTFINNDSIVIRKDQIKENDLMFYVSNECQINSDFLRINNMFSNQQLNQDNTQKGYFPDTCRVKIIRLKGIPSIGCLFTIDELINFCPKIKDLNLENFINQEFDTIDDILFCKPYIPNKSTINPIQRDYSKYQKKLFKYNWLIPEEFKFNYYTQQLSKNIHKINPNDLVTISVKQHGTSIIIGNVLTKVPKFGKFYNKIFKYLPKFLQFTSEKYNIVYSSRNVIKNQYSGVSYYESDIWKEYYNLLKDIIPQGYTIYGEIVGYETNSNSMIQKDYDYGCNPGENHMMIYRISQKVDGIVYEWNPIEIELFTRHLIKLYPHLQNRLHPIKILYDGKLSNLYPDIKVDDNWHDNVINRLKSDKNFGMEEKESLCNNNVPREGIVLRIVNDPILEAFKLKCIKFFEKESKEIDKGNVDIELENRNY